MRIIESNIAGAVKSMEYARNHHYLRLRDPDGRETVLIEHGLVKYICRSKSGCGYVFYSETGEANVCPLCGGNALERQWMRPQVSLVPEQESDFQMLSDTCPEGDDPQVP